MAIDGRWDCTVRSPLGEQALVLTLKAEGARFTGQASGAMGSMAIEGDLDGDTLRWKQAVTVPMAVTLDCEASVEGDALTGSVGVGGFGSYPITGKRAA